MRRPLSLSAALLVLPLALAPVACKRSAAVPDDTLAASVQSRIQADSALGSEPIQTGVQNGVVTLNGTVSSAAARSLAANDAAQVQGVRTVVNNLTVAAPQTASVDTSTAGTPAALPTPAPAPAAEPSTTESRRDRERRERQEREERAAANRQAAAASTRQNKAPVIAQTTQPAPVVQAPAPVQQVAPQPPPAPVIRNITVPTGTVLPIRITQTLDSATAQPGDTFVGSVASDVVIDGVTVLRQGSTVNGRVTAVQEAAHFKGNSLLSIELTGVSRRGDRFTLSTEPYSVQGKGRGKNTLEKTGGGAAIGAILGGIFGGGSGAAIGAAAGGGAGAGVNAITRGQQVQIPAESLVRFRLSNPVTVRVSGAAATSSSDANPDDSTPSQRRPLSQ